MSTCPVCYTRDASAYFVCGHGLCKRCAVRWLRCDDTCPMCRHVIEADVVDIGDLPDIDKKRHALMVLESERYTCTYNTNVFITDGLKTIVIY